MFSCSAAPAVPQPKHTLHLPLLPSCPSAPSVPADGQGLSRFLAKEHRRYSRSHSRSHVLGCWLVTSVLPTAWTWLRLSELGQERATGTTAGW